MNGSANKIGGSALERWPLLSLIMVAFVWIAHGLMFFSHEYAHSFAAWTLGWKPDPLLLHFGHLDAGNLIAQLDIDENVDYAPIFAAGRGPQASLIAAAGVVLGDGLPFAALAWLTGRSARGGRPIATLFLYLLCVMGVGNFIDYVPTRIFAPLDDMHTVEIGLGWSPWLLLVVLGTPFAIGGWYLFGRLLPTVRRVVFPARLNSQAMLVCTSTFLVFVFYAAAGLESGMGPISRGLSFVSIFVLFPLATLRCWPRAD